MKRSVLSLTEEWTASRAWFPRQKGLVAMKCEPVMGAKKYTLALPKDLAVNVAFPENATVEIVEY